MARLGSVLKKLSGKKTGKLEKRWDFTVGEPLISAPFVGKDYDGNYVIIFATTRGKVYVLSTDKKVRWTFEIEETLDEIQMLFADKERSKTVSTIPLFEDIDGDQRKEIVVGSENGKLYVIDHEGKLKWEFQTKGTIRSTPILYDAGSPHGKILLFGSSDHLLYALDGKGKNIWTFMAESGIESSPSVLLKGGRDDQIVFGDNKGYVYGISPLGRLLWKFKTGGQIRAKPIITELISNPEHRQTILIGSYDKNFYALDEQGNPIWHFSSEGSIRSTAAVEDINQDGRKEIVFGSNDNRVYALNDRGEKLWSYETDFWVVDRPLIVDLDNDKKFEIIVGSYDASLYVLDSQGEFMLNYIPGVSAVAMQSGSYSDQITTDPGHYTGKKLWEYKLDSLIVGTGFEQDNHEIVVSTRDGKVSVFVHRE
ncbi:MAG: PQQ-like beta-propeller repeat protein [DPANN group archaeon]|nr:PQQ-like beta-propeller repeat protein [DPANN group archaeon]